MVGNEEPGDRSGRSRSETGSRATLFGGFPRSRPISPTLATLPMKPTWAFAAERLRGVLSAFSGAAEIPAFCLMGGYFSICPTEGAVKKRRPSGGNWPKRANTARKRRPSMENRPSERAPACESAIGACAGVRKRPRTTWGAAAKGTRPARPVGKRAASANTPNADSRYGLRYAARPAVSRHAARSCVSSSPHSRQRPPHRAWPHACA